MYATLQEQSDILVEQLAIEQIDTLRYSAFVIYFLIWYFTIFNFNFILNRALCIGLAYIGAPKPHVVAKLLKMFLFLSFFFLGIM
jgi:hypothetical protein